MLACRRREPGGTFSRGGRPAWADRPGWPRASPGLHFSLARSFLLRDFLARVLHECTAQMLSPTPFLALLVLPLDASCFESCPCSLAPLASHATMKFL
jgi:hypothetical protein